jgi:hypothetical protein
MKYLKLLIKGFIKVLAFLIGVWFLIVEEGQDQKYRIRKWINKK